MYMYVLCKVLTRNRKRKRTITDRLSRRNGKADELLLHTQLRGSGDVHEVCSKSLVSGAHVSDPFLAGERCPTGVKSAGDHQNKAVLRKSLKSSFRKGGNGGHGFDYLEILVNDKNLQPGSGSNVPPLHGLCWDLSVLHGHSVWVGVRIKFVCNAIHDHAANALSLRHRAVFMCQ
jgi:hypothetical protein